MHEYAVQLQPVAPTVNGSLLTIADVDEGSLLRLLDLARLIRRSPRTGEGALAGKTVVLVMEKPSLRTRVTFEVAIHQLGGQALLLGETESRLGERESVEDFARNLSLWVDAIVARVFRHADLETLSAYATVPVVNALSDHEHPCQALADLMTLADIWPSVAGKQLVYVGDWNNVARSLGLAAKRCGISFRAVGPQGYGPETGEDVDWTDDLSALRGADAVYTDVWASMGEEADLPSRIERFREYQVNRSLMARTGKDAFFMHCLPAHRGLEVTDDVIESENSLVFDQAANRLHVEKAVLVSLMEASPDEKFSQKGRARVLRRPRHVDNHPLAQGKLWL